LQWKWKIQLDRHKHEYIVRENEHLNYELLIDDHNGAAQQHYCFYLERNAVLVVEVLMVHKDVDLIIECVLRGEGADARIVGAYGLHASNNVKIYTVQHHQAAHTRSNLVMKGVLRDNAHVQYHGTIRIEKEAQGSYALQENKNILLSSNARAVSVPSLEVLAHEVHCFHGSAIGRFDEEQLFYAAARAIDEQTAHQLLLNAFFADLFTDASLKEKMRSLNAQITR
jgi:Fe-S cluster assembly scaffold protein SufB